MSVQKKKKKWAKTHFFVRTSCLSCFSGGVRSDCNCSCNKYRKRTQPLVGFFLFVIWVVCKFHVITWYNKAMMLRHVFQERLIKKKRWAYRYIKIVMSMSVLSCVLYTFPQYFNADKKLSHHFGIEYKHRSPDFELLVTFELIMTLYSAVTLVSHINFRCSTYFKRPIERDSIVRPYVKIFHMGRLHCSKESKKFLFYS